MSTTAVPVRRSWELARSWLPAGRALPAEVWAVRHRWVVGVLLVQLALLPAFGLWRGYGIGHVTLDVLPAVLLAVAACWAALGVTTRSAAAALGVMTISTSLVHLADGYIEAHFHFFVMIPVVALYQTWVPFGLSIGLVLLHHGVMGTIAPESIFNHPAGQADPWLWAAIHSTAIAAACLGTMVNWRIQEHSREAEAALAAELAYRVEHDPLTDLPTRAVFLDRLGQARVASLRTRVVPTVMLLDLDGFKQVNDTLGHHAGDVVLVEVARRLRACLRAEDTVARLGGDEFAVLVTDGGTEAGQATAQRITAAVAEPFVIDEVPVDLEISIGIAPAGGLADDATVVRHADAAMYVAKEQRLGWAHYDSDDLATSSRLGMLGELRRALTEDEIVLHYQPKVSLRTGEPVGLEALARWQHPERGLLPPSDFIAVLERTNMSLPFTLHVLRLALDQLLAWRRVGLDLPVAVNVSARCLLHASLPDDVLAELTSRDLPVERLCLEITEDTLIANPEVSIATLHRIRSMGIRVSLDDFGIGYSSMSYLRDLPLDELKIDRSFVRDLAAGEARDEVMVRSVVDLAHELALPVVAEGVEDPRTQAMLLGIGCDTVQGYHLARPMPGDDVVTWVDALGTGARLVDPPTDRPVGARDDGRRP